MASGVMNILSNVKKTKEMIIDFRQKKTPLLPVVIKDEPVEIVDTYKHLGVTIDRNLNWDDHALGIVKKLNSRFYFLRKLNSFYIDNTLLCLFYKSILESILRFSIICWGGNATCFQKDRLDRIITKANKLCKPASTFSDFDLLYHVNVQRKILSIKKDTGHPLCPQIKYSERHNRYSKDGEKKPLLLQCKHQRYKNSFMPVAIKLL